MSFDSTKIKGQPRRIFVGESKMQVEKITCVADVSSSLQNKAFFFHDKAGAKHYAWFNVGGAGADPAFPGWTAHPVAISASATAAQVATALAAVLTAITGFDATADGDTVTLSHTVAGDAQPARDALDSDDQTGFSFEVLTRGETEEEVGSTQDDIDVSGLQAQTLEVKEHQSGSTPIARIVTGYDSPQFEITMQETDKAAIKRALAWAGQESLTPEASGGTELLGIGQPALGKSNPRRRVRLHPVAKGVSDYSEDLTFWACEINLQSLLFASEAVSTQTLQFTAYPDTSKLARIQFGVYGDFSKL